MQYSQNNQYTYNCYLDYLHYKASEILSLKSEVEDKVRKNRDIEIAENAIKKVFRTKLLLILLTFQPTKDIRTHFNNK